MGIKVGLCTIAFRDRPLEEALDLAAEAGMDCVEIWGKENHLPLDAGTEEAATVRQLAYERGLAVFSYGSYVRVFEEPDDAVFRKAVDMTVALGGDVLRVWAGGKASAETNMAEAMPVLAERSGKLADIAAAAGITVAFECHQNNLLDSSDLIVGLLQEVGRKNLRTYYQILVQANGEDPYEQARKLAPHTVAAHVHNVYADAKKPHYLRNGTYDYAKIAALLEEQGFHGPLFIEFVDGVDPLAALEKDAEYLRKVAVAAK